MEAVKKTNLETEGTRIYRTIEEDEEEETTDIVQT